MTFIVAVALRSNSSQVENKDVERSIVYSVTVCSDVEVVGVNVEDVLHGKWVERTTDLS